MGKKFLEQPVMIGGGWNREVPGQAKISHTGGFLSSKLCILELKQEKRGHHLNACKIVYGSLQKWTKSLNLEKSKWDTKKRWKSFLAKQPSLDT